MKKVILSLSILLCAGGAAIAQHKDNHNHDHGKPAVKAAPAQNVKLAAGEITPADKADDMVFKTMEHDFGTIAEGPSAEYEFVFKNEGSTPILINQVHASCGCTTPSWPKDPILPGKTGAIKASYSTTGRPGTFTKTITVLSGAGSKVLTIRGMVEKAPETSVPYNTSMIKTN